MPRAKATVHRDYSESHRCDDCRTAVDRCAECRAERARVQRERRAAKRAAKLCIDCHRTALAGFTRCRVHRAENNRLSLASHTRARESA